MQTRSPFSTEEPSSTSEGNLDMLDAGFEQACDDLAALAAQLCRAPLACLSLVGAPPHWFQGDGSHDGCATQDAIARCRELATLANDVVIIEDTRADPRFGSDPLVWADLGFGWCAAAPIMRADGSTPGTICVFDRLPRAFDAAQLLALRMLARQAACLLDLRAQARIATPVDIAARKLAEEERRKNGERLELALSGGDIGLWDLDLRTGKATYNEQWGAMFGYEPSEIQAVEDGFWKSIVHPDDYAGAQEGLLRHQDGETAMYEGEVRVRHKDGRWLWIQNRAKVVERDAQGRALRIVGVNLNITESKHNVTEHKRMRERVQEEQQRLRLIADNVPASVTHLDKHQRYTFANRFSEQFFGVKTESLLGRTMREVRGDATYAALAPHIDRALQGHAVEFENEVFTPAGRFFMQSSFIPDFDGDGQVQGIYAMTFDVTERKRAEIRSVDSERRLRGLTDNVPALLTELDLKGRVAFCNGRYQTWLGIAPESLIGRPIREAVGNAHYKLRKPLLDRAFAGEMVSFEQTTTLLVGERTLQTTYLPQRNAAGDVIGLYVLANDVTDLKHKQMQLDALAREDVLTGLPNRRCFEERARQALVRSLRTRKAICVVYLDIDHFKSINDSLGHAGGDAVLKEFGHRLKSSLRATDLAARLAGDEFVLVLEGAHTEHGARLVAEKVLKALQPAFCVDGRMVRVTASMGVALSTVGDDDLAPLLGRADSALYAAKNAGRNCFMMAGAAVATPA